MGERSRSQGRMLQGGAGVLALGALSWWLLMAPAAPLPENGAELAAEIVAPVETDRNAADAVRPAAAQPSRVVAGHLVPEPEDLGPVEPPVAAVAPVEKVWDLPELGCDRSGGVLSGRVLDEDLKPLAGVDVRVQRTTPFAGDWAGATTTAADGRFRLVSKDPETPWIGALVRVSAPLRATRWLRVWPTADTDVVLPPGARLKGRLRWPGGAPAREVLLFAELDGVRWGLEDARVAPAHETRTDADGAFTLRLPPDVGTLVLHPDHRLCLESVAVPLDAWRADPEGWLFTHVLPRGMALTVNVDGWHAAFDDARFRPYIVLSPLEQGDDGTWAAPADGRMSVKVRHRRHVERLRQGRARFDRLPYVKRNTTFRVDLRLGFGFRAPIVPLAERWQAQPGEHALSYPLPDLSAVVPAGHWVLEILLVDEQGQRQPPSVVAALTAGWPWPDVELLDAEGNEDALELDPVDGTAKLWTDFARPLSVSLMLAGQVLSDVVEARDERAELVLTAAVLEHIAGAVALDLTRVEAAGEALAPVLSLTQVTTGKPARPEVFFGVERVDGLAPGAWSYELRGVGMARSRGTVEVMAGSTTWIAAEPKQEHQATLAGWVGGMALGPFTARPSVKLLPVRGGPSLRRERKVSCLSDGSFLITDIPPGRWLVTASSMGGATARTQTLITLGPSEWREITLELEPVPFDTLWFFARRGGLLVPEDELVHVRLWRPSDGGLEVDKVVQFTGAFRRSGHRLHLPAGSYLCEVTLADGSRRTRKVEVDGSVGYKGTPFVVGFP